LSDLESPPAGDEGLEPEPVAEKEEGLEPDVDEGKSQEDEPKTFDEAYVKNLRKQAADERARARKAEREAETLRDTRISDTERLTKSLTEEKELRERAELRASSYEVAASRSLDLKWADYLTGASREDQEAKADELVKLLAAQGKSTPVPSFDGGVRATPAETKTPEEEHNLLLLRAAGRVQ
jgi:hypothetical protein